MHSAPAVTYPVGRSRFYGALVAVVALVSVAVGVLWLDHPGARGWRSWLYALSALGMVFVVGWRAFRSPRGSLHWDGEGWTWTTARLPMRATVHLHADFLFCLVLGLRTEDGKHCWLWPERSHDPIRWSALRRAVFSGDLSRRPADPELHNQRSEVKL